MRKFSTLTILALAVLFISCGQKVSQENYTAEVFTQKYEASKNENEISTLCQDFMENAEDINILREVQSLWIDIDEEKANTFSKRLADSNPNSAVYQYLYGRSIKSPVEQIEIGRKVIAIDSEFSYGYRLVVANYQQSLFSGNKTDEIYAKLEKMLPDDEASFEKFVMLDSLDSYPVKALVSYKAYKKDFEGALAILDNNQDKFKNWPNGIDYGNIYVVMGKYDEGLKAIRDEMNKRVEQGILSVSDASEYTDYYYKSALYSVDAYDQAIKYIKSDKNYSSDPNKLYDLACVYSLSGDNKSSMNTLNKAIKKGWDKVNHTSTDSDLEPLHSESKWSNYLDRIQKNWDDGKPKRKKEAFAKKIDMVAPEWNLEDVNGQMVSLESLKGKVVILDFWATWCGPCRTAMPMIDEFIEKYAKEDVVVFSINVWEKGKSKPAKFMTENEYDMTLLYGNNDLTKAYNVSGIPTLFVIDKEGHIRYQEIGVSDNLQENLIWWSEDLL
ncbi:MAG: TlpA disulfide reductase family protein [candidate division Zixibacteria bacterium]|nr:TlpA disulfide reductase family protein [candidate division Zixibacteria bacterium]